MKKMLGGLLLCFVLPSAFAGHHEKGEKMSNASADWQIEAYTSAAPDFIGDFASVRDPSGKILREGTNGWTCQSGNPRPFPANGWKDAHDAMPVCGDEEGFKWMTAALNGTKPDIKRDAFLWMLHGDVGEDNTKMGVLKKEDSTPGEWIESGHT